MKRKIAINAIEEERVQLSISAKKLCLDWSKAKATIRDDVLLLEHSPAIKDFTMDFLDEGENKLEEFDVSQDGCVTISADTSITFSKTINISYFIPENLNTSEEFDKFRIFGLSSAMETNQHWQEYIEKHKEWYNEVYEFWKDSEVDPSSSDNFFEWIYAIAKRTRFGHIYVPLTKLLQIATSIEMKNIVLSTLLSIAHVLMHSEKFKDCNMASQIFICIMEEFLGGNQSLHTPEAESALYEFVMNKKGKKAKLVK